MEVDPSSDAINRSVTKEILNILMEPESSLPCSQEQIRRSILILSSHLHPHLRSGLFWLSDQNTVCLMRATRPVNFIFFDFIIPILFGEERKL
jgi:hypothetical protein